MSRIPLFALALLAATSTSVRANDVSYSASVLNMAVGTSSSVSLPQFDPALGIPVHTRVTVSGWVSGTWSLENTASSPSGIGGGTSFVGTRIPTTLPLGSLPGMPNPAFVVYQPVSLAAFDGVVDYAGTSGIVVPFTNEQGDGGPSLEMNLLGSNVGPYSGTGSFSVGLGPITEFGSPLPAGMQSSVAITVDVVVTVRYFFDAYPAHICRPLYPAGGCPCGNYPTGGALDNGCANSLSASGGRLDATGTASIAGDSLILSGSGMTNSSALYFQGSTLGFVTNYYGDGLRCVGGTVVRLGTRTNAAGASQYPVAGDLPISVRGNVLQPGTRYYQVVYRDLGNYCTPDLFNITSGLAILWTP